MSLKPKVALAQDFLSNLPKLPNQVQAKVLKWALRFQSDPTASSINYETIKAAKDPSLRSVRIDQDWRGIVFKSSHGDVYVLMYVDHHDAAYRWAENRRVAVNPVTGAMQIFAVETVVEPAVAAAREEATQSPAGTPGTPVETPALPAAPLYAALSDDELLSLGTPAELIAQVRTICTEVELDAMQAFLPVEAYEGLFLVAAGDSVSDLLVQRETRVDRKVDTEDFATAIETAESQARFIVVDGEEAMAAILNSPLAQWRVFLHPTQRKLAQGDRSGPVRVLGGAGTGKTVLAMHRAKWLAENRIPEGRKLFFTTFTRNLASDIEENLKTLCHKGVMQKIEVQNLDAWVHGFLRRQKCNYTIVFGRNQDRFKGAKEAWDIAMQLADSTLGLTNQFYEEEFERVICAQGITTRDEYRQAKRKGRGTILSRSKRDAIWPVFEEYRTGLTTRNLKEVDDAYRDAAALLKDQPPEFSSVVVDETQDFGPQALQLLRAMVPAGPNDMFLVGDGHQRIYNRNRASMSASGIDIRGRARKLYLNYRTTEEIRRVAVAMLEGCEADDLDEGSDEVKRYKSISHGPVPERIHVTHFEEALSRLVPIVEASMEQGHSICVLVRARQDAEIVRKALKEQKIPVTLIGPDERDQPDSKSARVATMHRAKGLEFDEVVLLMPRQTGDPETMVHDTRRLQYVAITRAKRRATMLEFS